MLYESLLLVAVVFIAGFLFAGQSLSSAGPLGKVAYQLYLLGVIAIYFIWFWLHGGQTLAMKTWHLRLVSVEGPSITLRQAVLRFIVALPGTLLGFGILWALFDPERLFLHDRLAKTKILLIADS